MKKEVLTISVQITNTQEVKGHGGSALMLLFTGTCDCALFTGTILPGAVDTQVEKYGQVRSLCARYILEGKDYSGKKCRVFIENNAEVKNHMITKPKIYTDSDALQFLENECLTGTITPDTNGVIIHIFIEE